MKIIAWKQTVMKLHPRHIMPSLLWIEMEWKQNNIVNLDERQKKMWKLQQNTQQMRQKDLLSNVRWDGLSKKRQTSWANKYCAFTSLLLSKKGDETFSSPLSFWLRNWGETKVIQRKCVHMAWTKRASSPKEVTPFWSCIFQSIK